MITFLARSGGIEIHKIDCAQLGVMYSTKRINRYQIGRDPCTCTLFGYEFISLVG